MVVGTEQSRFHLVESSLRCVLLRFIPLAFASGGSRLSGSLDPQNDHLEPN